MTALSGLRLLDLSHMLAGPYCAMMLADLGMEVVKIEPPAGERTRRLLADDPRYARGGMGAYALTLNRNKKAVAIDLKAPGGRQLLHALAAEADVLLTNFSVGVTERLGVDPETLEEVNPRLVTCSITGFGETGPHRQRTSFDLVAQATGGGMSLGGESGGRPLRAGLPVGDLGAGMMAATGILAALQARQRTGRGQHVDISMQDAQVSLLNYVATMHLMSGELPEQLGNAHAVHVPYDTYPASDGWLVVAVIWDEFWPPLVDLLSLPELDTPEHRRQPGRLANRAAIDAALTARFRTRPRDWWLERLRAARIPCAPVNDVREVFADPQVGRPVRQPGNPIKLSDAGPEAYSRPPAVGEHTGAILGAWLGLDEAAVGELRARGVVR